MKPLYKLVIFIFLFACEKENLDIHKKTDVTPSICGTYIGKRITVEGGSSRIDSLNLIIDSVSYRYCSSLKFGIYYLDYGSGYYTIEKDSIEFRDENARDCLHSWEWILSGRFKFSLVGDSLTMRQTKDYSEIKYYCRKF